MGIAETLLARPVLFRPDLAITDTDIDALAQRLSLAMKLRAFDRISTDEPVLFRASTVAVGDLVISTGFHSPMHVVTEEAPRATVILALGGETSFRYEGGALHFGALHDLAYLPGCPYVEQSRWISGVLFSVDVERLIRTATTMAGYRASTKLIRQRLQRPQLIRPEPGSGAMEVVQHLLRQFGLLDVPHLEQEHLLELLCLDDLLYRTIALALCGDLIRTDSEDDGRLRCTKAAIIDDLLAWIRSNLDRPISLTELERQSAYSQRTLRTAFQERFGCGPHEWIRRQRMELARQRLVAGEHGDSVSSVARRCGYAHLSQFSRDFYRSFGVTPSRVLRQGRSPLN